MARPRTFDEEQAIDKAIEVFWSKGFADTSICDLEHALGMGRQSLYNAFGDKRELFVRALRQYYEQGSRHLENAFQGNSRGLTAIKTHFELSVEAMTASEDRKGCFLIRSLIDHGVVDPEVSKHCQSNEANLNRVFTNALQEAIEDGDLNSSYSIESAAALLASQFYGLNIMARSGAARERMHEVVNFLFERLRA